MTSVHVLLERAAASPSRPVDVGAIVQTARRRRRQHHGIAMVLAVLMLGGAVLAVVDRDEGGSPRVVVPPAAAPDLAPLHVPDGWTPLAIPEAGMALALPPGWSRLPDLADSAVPNVMVGTGTPPARDASATCTPAELSPAPPGAWIELYRYPGAGPFPYPTGSGGLPPDMIVARPDFLSGSKFNLRCIPAAGTSEIQDNGVEGFVWGEQGRVFFARLVVVGDPDQANNRLGRQVLDTLRVLPDDGTSTATSAPGSTSEASPATQPPAPSTTLPSPPTSSSDEARAVRDTVVNWLDGRRDVATSPDYVEDYDQLGDLLGQGRAQHSAGELATFRGRVDVVSTIDDTHAFVRYTLYKSDSGATVYGNLPGVVVKIDGRWKMSRETVCDLLAQGGISCPPRSEPSTA